MTSKVWQQLACLLLIGTGALVGYIDVGEVREQYLSITCAFWLQCVGAIWYTRLITKLQKYGTLIRVVLASGFLAIQVSTISKLTEFDPTLSSLSMLVGGACTVSLIVLSVWKTPTRKVEISMTNDKGTLPIFMQVTITGASSVDDEEARKSTIERVLKPFTDKLYETTNLTGQDNGEFWVLLMRKF